MRSNRWLQASDVYGAQLDKVADYRLPQTNDVCRAQLDKAADYRLPTK